jgi:hypothetical protein
MSPPKTKRDLLARLLAGPIGIERIAVMHSYRVFAAGDADPVRGAYIDLVPEFGFILVAYDTDHAPAYVGRKTIALTPAEADALAARVQRTFRVGRRSGPPGFKRRVRRTT